MAPREDYVIGTFDSVDAAGRAAEALQAAGFEPEGIGVLARHGETDLVDTGLGAGGGPAAGAVTGGIVGGMAGWMVGATALVIPGVGPLIAAGSLVAALSGAALGAGVGAVAGALAGMGLSDAEARRYEEEVQSGRALVTVHARARAAEAATIMRRNGARDLEESGPSRGILGTTPTTTSQRDESERL